MNRLQRKCVLASVCLHGLLCLVLVVGPALMTRKIDDTPSVITLVNATLTDGASGGGTAGPVAPPPADPPVRPTVAQPTVVPPVQQPLPEPPKKQEEIKPVDPAPKVVDKPKVEDIPKVPDGDMKLTPVPKKKAEPTKAAVQDPVKRPLVVKKEKTEPKAVPKAPPKIDLSKTVKRDTKAVEEAMAKANAEREGQRRQQLADLLGKGARNIQRNTSKAATVEASGGGDGSGGQASINYRQYVALRYKTEYDGALAKAAGIAAGDLVVRASVTINSSGRVVASEITTKSGSKELDRLVQRVLDGVKQIEGFPPGAQDSERTFNLRFQLDSESRQG